MTVLSPGMLLLGLAVAVPLVLHLLQRHQAPRLTFPALRYLRRAEREHASRIRLRQLLLLAVRVLALLLLALAGARPFLAGAGSGHEPTSVVLILDNSLSSSAVVGDRRVLDDLKTAARTTLSRANTDDRFWLIRAGASWEPAVAGPAAAIVEAVDATQPTAAAADLGAEVLRARSILSGEPDDRPREVHLISDLQATNLRRLEGADPTLVMALVPEDDPPANRGITAVEVGGGLSPRAGERSTVAVELRGAGDSIPVRLAVEGSTRAAGTTRPGSATVLPLPVGPPGVFSGRVEIDADALTGDDRRYFTVRVSPPPVVAVTEPLPFLEEALDVLSDAGRLRRGPVPSAEVVVAPGARGAEEVRTDRGVVILPPSTPLELAAANQRLSAAGIPWRFGTPRAGEARLGGGRADDVEGTLGEARLRTVYELESQGGSRGDSTLLRLSDGSPWAVAGSAGGGRYVILATPLTADASSIPTSEAMLPLLDRAVSGWAADVPERTAYEPGDVVQLPPGDSLVTPEGAGPGSPGDVYRFTRPGVYRVLRNGEAVSGYAVNPPALETDLRRLDRPGVMDALPGRVVRAVTAENWEHAIYSARLGMEVAWPLLLLALALLLAESALAAAGRTAPRRPREISGRDRNARGVAPAGEA